MTLRTAPLHNITSFVFDPAIWHREPMFTFEESFDVSPFAATFIPEHETPQGHGRPDAFRHQELYSDTGTSTEIPVDRTMDNPQIGVPADILTTHTGIDQSASSESFFLPAIAASDEQATMSTGTYSISQFDAFGIPQYETRPGTRTLSRRWIIALVAVAAIVLISFATAFVVLTRDSTQELPVNTPHNTAEVNVQVVNPSQ